MKLQKREREVESKKQELVSADNNQMYISAYYTGNPNI